MARPKIEIIILFLVCALLGAVSGILIQTFLLSLYWVTNARENNPFFILILPVFGLVTVWLYKKILPNQSSHPERKGILIWITTLLTHLGGGSAGREGTAIQISTSLFESFLFYSKKLTADFPEFHLAGIAAGFSSAVGAPWAGFLFAFEYKKQKPTSTRTLICCLVASTSSFWVGKMFFAKNHSFAHLSYDTQNFMSLDALIGLFFAALAFGVIARTYRFLESFFFRRLRFYSDEKKIFWGGLALALCFQFPFFQRYSGLGLGGVQEALLGHALPFDFVLKMILTAFTLAIGFRGGEFIPLVFTGVTAGWALEQFAPSQMGFILLGYGAVYASVMGVPLAGSVMVAELFGWNLWPWATVVFMIANKISHGLQSKSGI